MIEKTLQDLKALVAVAGSDRAPDVVIQGGSVFDVFTGETFPGDLWVCGSWIAYVGEKKAKISEETKVVDASGLIAVPGYIDAHGHVDMFYNPATFSDVAVAKGTTTVFSDSHDLISCIGPKGFVEVLRSARGFNMKYLWGVPATYPPYPEVEGGEMFSIYDIWSLFSRYPECASVSEVSSYLRIIRNEDEILERMLLARSLGKNVEGHTLGASYDRLNALVAAGITSCHESIRPADLKNRIRLGLYTMVRHSSIRSDLEDLCPAINALPNDSIILVSDGIFADALMGKGYMDHIVSEAVRFGLRPRDAIRMATINPARYFKVDSAVGSLTPGRIADVLLLESLERPSPVTVFERGTLAAEAGVLAREPSPQLEVGVEFYPYAFSSVEAAEFVIERLNMERVPVIDIVDRTVTRRMDLALPRVGNSILPDRQGDVRKILYTRREQKRWGQGFLHGFGARCGGVASTVAHETHGLLVHGFDDDDMALAANTVLAMKGGIVIVDGGKVLHALRLPLGAIMSRLPLPELDRALRKLVDLLHSLGNTLDDPLWTMGFLPFTSIVELRITVSGTYDVRKGSIVF
ncbi:MAG: adenine deaminase C-terminal domain-containing protein [Syntrophorhabdaceae bacterium]|nr:adenine deaminase C-terminal domain-containing protein [Syntrophorhabdaceae bacterium]